MEILYFEIALYRFIRHQRSNEGPAFTVEDFEGYVASVYFSESIFVASRSFIKPALTNYVRYGFLSHFPDRYAGDYYSIKADNGVIQTFLENESAPYRSYSNLGAASEGWLVRALRAIEAETDGLAKNELEHKSSDIIVDDNWEPLPLQRGAELDEALSRAEEAVVAIRADNGFAASYPAERDNLVLHAEATVASGRQGKVTRLQVRQSLVGAGKWLMDKFGGTSIGTLGGELVKWGLRLLGLIP